MSHVDSVLEDRPVATLELDLAVDRLPDGILQLYCTPAQCQSMLAAQDKYLLTTEDSCKPQAIRI